MATPSTTVAPLDAELVRHLVSEVLRRLTLALDKPEWQTATLPGSAASTPPTAPARETPAAAAGPRLCSAVISLAAL